MVDYTRILDEEVQTFIAKSAQVSASALSHLNGAAPTVDDQRAAYNTMCAAFAQPHPKGVTIADSVVGRVPIRTYMPAGDAPNVTVLFAHGGGFVLGGLDSHDDICAEVCAATGYRVVAVDYRLAPEHKHPAAFDDTYAVAEWIEAMYGGPMVLLGDSAGGNLVAAIAHAARGRLSSIVGQVLIYPALGGDQSVGSYVTHAYAPMLTTADMDAYNGARAGGAAPLGDARFAPLEDTDFTGLPPTVSITAECDPLSDDGGVYRDRIIAAGGLAHWIDEPALVHAHLRARHSSRRARDAFDRITAAVFALGQGDWPFDG